MNKPRIGTKRALSSVVTMAILLTAVATMGVTIVAWSQSNLAYHQILLESSFSDHLNKLKENLLIEHIWFGGTGPSVNVTINNIGTVGLNVTEIAITNITSGQNYYFPYTNGGIVPGGSFSVNETFGWVNSISYDVVVTTDRGSLFKDQVVAP